MCLSPIEGKLISFIDENGELCNKFLIGDFPFKVVPLSCDIVQVPCNRCFECMQAYSREWSCRIMCEANLHKKNCFITLTYERDPVSLSKRDLSLFLKRLRKFLSKSNIFIRFYACGEYGKKNLRPHYHVIIFGWFPEDAILFNKINNLYGSKTLESIWNNGFVSVGEVTPLSSKYCCKYMQKFQFTDYSKLNLEPPFITMSSKPGIGLEYFLNNKDRFISTDKIIFEGFSYKIPRYFLRKLKLDDFESYKKICSNRFKKSSLFYKPFYDLSFLRKKKLVLNKLERKKYVKYC